MNFDELLSVTLGQLEDASREVLENSEMKVAALKRRRARCHGKQSNRIDQSFQHHKLWFDLHRLVNATHTSEVQSNATEASGDGSEEEGVQAGDAMKVIPKVIAHLRGERRFYLSNST